MTELPLTAVELYRKCREAASQVASTPGQATPLTDPDYWWAPHWFPITSNGYGGVVACDCSSSEGQPTPIRMVWWAGRESFAEPVTDSFARMVTWWIDALRKGVWRYNQAQGQWQVDHELLDDPSRELTRLV